MSGTVFRSKEGKKLYLANQDWPEEAKKILRAEQVQQDLLDIGAQSQGYKVLSIYYGVW